jgi:hypothetical protein
MEDKRKGGTAVAYPAHQNEHGVDHKKMNDEVKERDSSEHDEWITEMEGEPI